jgi:hypothetical protein
LRAFPAVPAVVSESRDEIVRRWRTAEERLYPVVMVRPDLYERYISVVRAVADELRAYGTLDELVAAYEQGAEVIARVVRAQIISTEGMDLGLVAGAAFSLRHREVAEEMNREEALRRIHEARAAGDEWAVVYETSAGVPPYRRLEMRLADGAALHVFVETDPDTGGPLFGVEPVQLDPRTGDWVTDAEPLAPRRTFRDPEPWTIAIDELRASPTG